MDRSKPASVEPGAVISRDPDVHSGDVVFAGTRVPVDTLIDYLKHGESVDDFLEGFPTVNTDEWTVELQGVDIFDPVRNTIHATRADEVAPGGHPIHSSLFAVAAAPTASWGTDMTFDCRRGKLKGVGPFECR